MDLRNPCFSEQEGSCEETCSQLHDCGRARNSLLARKSGKSTPHLSQALLPVLHLNVQTVTCIRSKKFTLYTPLIQGVYNVWTGFVAMCLQIAQCRYYIPSAVALWFT